MPATPPQQPHASAAPTRRQCLHCGTPFAPRSEQEQFCCSGCEAVHNLIESQGLSHFYALRKGIGTPVAPRAFEPRDFSSLQQLAQTAERQAHGLPDAESALDRAATPDTESARDTGATVTNAVPAQEAAIAAAATFPDTPALASLTLDIDGLHCIGCRWLIAELFLQQPGHGTIEIDMEAARLHLSWVALPPIQPPTQLHTHTLRPALSTASAATQPSPVQSAPAAAGSSGKPVPTFDLVTFASQLQAYGYILHPAGEGGPSAAEHTTATGRHSGRTATATRGTASAGDTRRRLLPRLLLCGVFSLNAILLSLPQHLGVTAEDFPLLRLFGLLVFLCATIAVALSGSYFLQHSLRQSSLPAAGMSPRPARRPRYDIGRGAAFALFGCYGAVLLGRSVNLPGLPGADALAAISFIMLLTAYIFKR